MRQLGGSVAAGLSLGELELVLAVIEAKAVRAAARTKGLKPSHVSKVVARVEKELGVQLLMRSASGVVVTREGLAFKTAAVDVLTHAEALGHLKNGGVKSAPIPVITIGAAAFLARSLIAGAVGDLAREVKDVRFRVLEVAPDGVLAAGLKGAIDVAVHVGALDWTKLWTSKGAGKLRWGLFGRTGHPLGAHANEAACAGWSFVVPTYWSGSAFEAGNDQCPMEWERRVRGHEASSADAAVAIAAATDQLVFAPTIVAQRAGLAEIAIEEWEPVERPLVVSVRSDRVKQGLLGKLLKAVGGRI